MGRQLYRLRCVNCGESYQPDEIVYTCRKCGHLLAVEYDLDSLKIRHSLGAGIEAHHFVIEAAGESGRGARSEVAQGYYLLGPAED